MRCPACPVPAGRPCVVEAGADPWFCSQAGDPAWAAFLVDHSPPAPDLPPCPHRGPVVDTGEGCGCGPTRLCRRDTRVVSAADCLSCLSPNPPL